MEKKNVFPVTGWSNRLPVKKASQDLVIIENFPVMGFDEYPQMGSEIKRVLKPSPESKVIFIAGFQNAMQEGITRNFWEHAGFVVSNQQKIPLPGMVTVFWTLRFGQN
ncbi:MAG: hypothetical protein J4215_01970 [Candidatus Diapherotrites archaeon]|uniref:Uncharacterized protein n=1 Tax=Candidatus Iainarchaeum sp. TaxID=3101447 RepID=A0A8T4LEK2_9ARCH|nr:hypothetical protein [Candidatus Diapherotrites archaeon]